MTINIENEVTLWFDKKGNIEVRCGKCQSKPDIAQGAQGSDQMKYMLTCAKCGTTLVEYGSPEELATDLSQIVRKWRL